jgi:hypothetical protein
MRSGALFAVVAVAAALSASAGGSQDEGVGVIVEFFDPPRVVAQRQEASGGSITRFRRDIGALHGRVATSSEAPAPAIAREYRNLVTGVALTVPPAMIEELRRLPYVKSIVRDAPVRFFDTPVSRGTPAANAQYTADVTILGADKLWEMGSRGQGVVVAVIDTGVDYRLPSLGGCFGAGCRVAGGYDFENNDADPMDSVLQHGTAVANIIAGNSDNYTGVAPEATLLAYRVAYNADILAAMERAVDPNGDGDFSDRADVMNLSLGTGGAVVDVAVGGPSDVATAANNAARTADVDADAHAARRELRRCARGVRRHRHHRDHRRGHARAADLRRGRLRRAHEHVRTDLAARAVGGGESRPRQRGVGSADLDRVVARCEWRRAAAVVPLSVPQRAAGRRAGIVRPAGVGRGQPRRAGKRAARLPAGPAHRRRPDHHALGRDRAHGDDGRPR